MKIPVRTLLVTSLLIVAFWIASYSYIRHGGFARVPKEHARLERLVNVGNALGAIGVLFSGLAFGALVITIWIQTKQVEAANEQAKLTLEGIKEAGKQQLYLSLEPRIGEVISNDELKVFLPRFPHAQLNNDPRLNQAALDAYNEQEFLALLAAVLQPLNIPLHQRFRRQTLFKALDRLCSTSSPEQAQQFKDVIQSQIHDESARMLIIKALAEKDGTTLRIYGRLGIDFNVLNDSQAVADKLVSLYPKTQGIVIPS